MSLYAASKKANELMANTYSHLYGLPATRLRFFTVYGPWGRPDMALFLSTKAMLDGEPIQVFNIDNSNPTPLMVFIEAIEVALRITVEKLLLPMQLGDVPATAADRTALEAWKGLQI